MSHLHAALFVCLFLALLSITLTPVPGARAEDDVDDSQFPEMDPDITAFKEGSRTDNEAVAREEEAIKLDGLSVAEMKLMRDSAEKYAFQAEVDKMMKIIINSLYKNKEIFIRELISNASDALDKIRFQSLTAPEALEAIEEMSIRIKVDEDGVLHITDTGIGMTKRDLEVNLGTIAKSGTSDFIDKMSNIETDSGETPQTAQDLIGQFGVGFYSSFLVADTVIVTTKHNDDVQYIWESNGSEFSISEDPRGDTLKRGTTISLYLKEEAKEYTKIENIKNLIKKYSQFINFPIYAWDSHTETVEEPIDDESIVEDEDKEDVEDKADDDDVEVDEEKKDEEDKPKTKSVEKTYWDWTLMNDVKPIWRRKPNEVGEEEYTDFYSALTKVTSPEPPISKIHFIAEGEVTFRSILYIPDKLPHNFFSDYSKKLNRLKLYVRRVFITEELEEFIPRYLAWIWGVVDSDDLPLNVGRESLQQHKLLKVIKKKVVKKILEMIKKMNEEEYKKFWEQFGSSLKLGVLEDSANKTRLAKFLRFQSSNDKTELTSLEKYLERMKEKQTQIYFMGGVDRVQVEQSPFVERVLKKGYEVIYLLDPIDEYVIQSLPEFESKKFQDISKEGLEFPDEGDQQKEILEGLSTEYKPLTDWLEKEPLKDVIEKATVSNRLTDSPCAIVSSSWGWSSNMERVARAQAYGSNTADAYMKQKKTLEINTRHPVIKELLRRVSTDSISSMDSNTARVLYDTAVLRSGYTLSDSQEFAKRIEKMLRTNLDVSLDASVEPEPETEITPEEDFPEVELLSGDESGSENKDVDDLKIDEPLEEPDTLDEEFNQIPKEAKDEL